ncbi:outer membrane beta-barrel protein [Flavobacterium nitratireducens]|uniref:outer membrane beta-barrel protein n=1 Tax=Flavobacterium nitratireducens TaxID=992289 RepID=UPI0024157E07|nr:outer membrane beta-barrel protein [Flavobacterium nitratireducens]
MKKFLLAFCLLFITKSISQNYRFSTDASFQNPSSHNFISDNSNGVIDLGIKYRVLNSKKTKFGISFNAGILKSNRDRNNVAGNFKITSYQLQPKIFTELNFSHFTPFVGVGYTSMLFKSSTDDRKIYAYNRDGFSLNNTQSGIDLKIGIGTDF